MALARFHLLGAVGKRTFSGRSRTCLAQFQCELKGKKNQSGAKGKTSSLGKGYKQQAQVTNLLNQDQSGILVVIFPFD